MFPYPLQDFNGYTRSDFGARVPKYRHRVYQLGKQFFSKEL